MGKLCFVAGVGASAGFRFRVASSSLGDGWHETQALRSMAGRDLAQPGKNLRCGHGLGLPGIEARNATHNLRLPRGIGTGFRGRLDADKEAISEGNTLIGWKHESVVRKSIESCWHKRIVRRRAWRVETECGGNETEILKSRNAEMLSRVCETNEVNPKS
jgi:hypothetical protein